MKNVVHIFLSSRLILPLDLYFATIWHEGSESFSVKHQEAHPGECTVQRRAMRTVLSYPSCTIPPYILPKQAQPAICFIPALYIRENGHLRVLFLGAIRRPGVP